MNIVLRADASLEMGSGHVMRCLTLASLLREQGHACEFICREHAGHLADYIEARGFPVHRLPLESGNDCKLDHSSWLGATQVRDAQRCLRIVSQIKPEWLVVDHYGLDQAWELELRKAVGHMMVIDDLADRKHHADILLDQNLGRTAMHYAALVSAQCKVMAGPINALVRPEFQSHRVASLQRRAKGEFKEILVTLGGVDLDNHTCHVLEALKHCSLPPDVAITVVLGNTSPHIDAVRELASSHPWSVEVLCGIDNMAERMSRADLAIGAGGGTSWERCTLGLPTLLVVLAENQRPASVALQASGAVELVRLDSPLAEQLAVLIKRLRHPGRLREMGHAAAVICDGAGAQKIAALFHEFKH